MIHKISEKAIMYAILNNYIKQEQYDEYVYALEIILNILITDITMIIIGLAMGMIWECILFWLVYKILRKYCGGYHFSTSLKCYLSSCIMCPVVLAVVRYVPYSMTVWGLLNSADNTFYSFTCWSGEQAAWRKRTADIRNNGENFNNHKCGMLECNSHSLSSAYII